MKVELWCFLFHSFVDPRCRCNTKGERRANSSNTRNCCTRPQDRTRKSWCRALWRSCWHVGEKLSRCQSQQDVFFNSPFQHVPLFHSGCWTSSSSPSTCPHQGRRTSYRRLRVRWVLIRSSSSPSPRSSFLIPSTRVSSSSRSSSSSAKAAASTQIDGCCRRSFTTSTLRTSPQAQTQTDRRLHHHRHRHRRFLQQQRRGRAQSRR